MRYLCWTVGEGYGGCEAYIVQMVEYAKAKGWRPTVICGPGAAEEFRRRISGVRIEVPAHVSLVRSGGRFWQRRRVRRPVELLAYAKLLLKIRPHIVHSVLPLHVPSAGPMRSDTWISLCSRLGIPNLMTFQLVEPRWPPKDQDVSTLRQARARGARFCAISRNNRELICDYFQLQQSDVTVIPNRPRRAAKFGVRTDVRREVRTELGVSDADMLIITVAQLHERKGHDLIVGAMGGILEAFPTAKFLWVGEGDRRPVLTESLTQRGLLDRVMMTGWREDVVRLLAASDLFLFATRCEGGESIALGEAVAAGLPVVASNASGIPELLRDGVDGYLFPVDDSAALGRCVRMALGDPVEAKRRACSAQQRLAMYTEEDMLRDTFSLLEDTAKG